MNSLPDTPNLDDTKVRWVVNLLECNIEKGRRTNGDRTIEISYLNANSNKEAERVRLAFDNDTDFREWGTVFAECRVSNEKLRESQVIRPYLEKQRQIQ